MTDKTATGKTGTEAKPTDSVSVKLRKAHRHGGKEYAAGDALTLEVRQLDRLKKAGKV
ncbi:DUF7210 family protein [Cobetia sp. cqz5-12]|uniref:DUF7210 family protein n=1 Tax=Cobetia sp. cqz5-12 TaxID=2609415 RepID=UPI0019048DE7|nr:hypothetical protein [Cobetia sp. cqz5-12]